jgi:hypothetical protein
MKVRLVAYRKQTTSSSELSQFELDLQEEPNVIINYNWLDLKDPSSRKASFSQTLKLPFSNANNKFFENYFDVNLDILVFNAQRKFNAILYVDSIPQLKGFIQLKSIMLNARLYEVALFGQTADFFTDIKSKKLRDVFTNPSASNPDIPVIDTSFNHYFSSSNVVKSWSSPGLSLIDGGNTNDIMYPIIDHGHTFNPYSSRMFYKPSMIANDLSYNGAIRVGDLKPAIRMQRLLLLIAQKAGYTIKSTFLGIDGTTQSDTSFFSRLFMTLATENTRTQTLFNTTSGSENAFVGFEADLTNTTGTQINTSADFANDIFYGDSCIQHLDAFNEVYDPNNIFSITTPGYGVFFGTPISMPTITLPEDFDGNDVVLSEGNMQVNVNFTINIPTTTSDGSPITNGQLRYGWLTLGGSPLNNTYTQLAPVATGANTINTTFNLQSFPGVVYNFFIASMYLGGTQTVINFGNEVEQFVGNFDPVKSYTPNVSSLKIQILPSEEMAITNGFENGIVSMFDNMPDVLQEDFVKDLINRFNLIVKTDEEDEKKLIIEPYQDYVNLGSTQYWTDKLDLSKEQVIKPATELQSKRYIFGDNESEDIFNSRYFKTFETVYGTYKEKKLNEFAKGEFKNFSIMSPFIAQGLSSWNDGNLNFPMIPPEVAIAYLFKADENSTRSPLEQQKPKIYYYSGTPITVNLQNYDFDFGGTIFKFFIYSNNYLMNNDKHPSDDNDGSVTKFPLCTQYNLDSIGAGINANTKILHWTWYSPYFNSGFSFNFFGNTYSLHGYYNDYWASYLNELTSDESRIMECHINLNEQDISSFAGSGFQNTFFIKNTLWRVLEISNYLVGGNKSTKVKLIKVIEKLPNDCGLIGTVTSSGQVTYVDSATGSSSTNVTNVCCEEYNEDWTFVQQNSTTGVGLCYGTPSNSFSASFLPPVNPPDEPDSYGAIIPSALPTIQNSYPTSMGYGNSIQFFCDCTTNDNSTVAYLSYKGSTINTVTFPKFVTSYVKMKLTGTILKGTNEQRVGFFEYEIVISDKTLGANYVGTNGGKVLNTTKESAFTSPTVNLNNFVGESWKPTVTGGSNELVFWVAEFNITSSPMIFPGTGTDEFALYQDTLDPTNITFQNASYLIWN